MAEQFCLKWNNYQLSLTSAFKHILEEEDFVDVTLSAEGQSLKGHKVVLSACSSYFKELLKGISPWQHPVLVLRDVPFNDLQSILEFVYLGEVNLEQGRLESFLKTAEILQIKGLTDGIKDPGGIKMKTSAKDAEEEEELEADEHQIEEEQEEEGEEAVDCKPDISQLAKRALEPDYDITVDYDISDKRIKLYEESDMVIDDGGGSDNDGSVYSGEHIIVSGDPVAISYLNRHPPPPGVKEDLGPLHKRCTFCHMIMLKKNMSRHVRDQHTADRPRSVCPICQKTYKTSDWLKDHIRRGHGFTKEDTDDLMAKIKLDTNMNLGKSVSTAALHLTAEVSTA